VTAEPVRPEEAGGALVTAAARKLWRAVGTTAWAVLCDVALDAEPDSEGRLVAATNVRRIADHLGISKDTAARALARLHDAGLIGRQAEATRSTFHAAESPSLDEHNGRCWSHSGVPTRRSFGPAGRRP
jgi:hypothetical protein